MSRELRNTRNRYIVEKENNAMSETSSQSGTGKLVEKIRQNFKENRVIKNSEGTGNVVERLKIHYEQISMTRKNVTAISDENAGTSGAIKKCVQEEKLFGTKKHLEFSDEKSVGSKKRIEFGNDKSSGAKKRVKINISENDVFAKSRFKVYTDEQIHNSEETVTTITDDKSNENRADARHGIRNRRLSNMILESSVTVHERLTPIEALGVPLIPKKVKIQHRNSSMNGSVKPNNHIGSISQNSAFQLPYEDNFVKLELEKEKPLFRVSRGFRNKNITVAQRKIILKFLLRLNVHSFYPSFILYQTVRIFDAVLDAKLIDIEEMQLVALAAMWIALKREQIAYRLPSAAQMISFSKDLYEGRVDLLLKCEREILQSLNCEIVFPDPYSILYYYITTCKRSPFLQKNQVELVYYCGSYMIDLSLFDENLMKTSVVLLAAAAAEAALFFVMDEGKCEPEPWWFKWRSPDAMNRFSENEIGDVRSTLIQLINESHQRHTDGEIVFKKYQRSRYGKISHFLCNKVELFLSVD